MAGTEINLYGVGDVNLTALMNTVDSQRVTYHALSLTNYDNDLEPAIAAGSFIEVGGTLFSFGVELAITGWAGIGNDTPAYIKLVPAGTSPDTVTAIFTDTAPVWSDAKQGWYGTAAAANHRYVAGLYRDDAASYDDKWLYEGRGRSSDGYSRMRTTKNDAQTIPTATITIVEYDDVDFDNLSEYDNVANFRYTAKEAGYRMVIAALESVAVAWEIDEFWEIRLYKNGAIYSYGSRSSGSAQTFVQKSILTDIIYLAATDYIDIRIWHDQGGDVNTSATISTNNFSVHRLN